MLVAAGGLAEGGIETLQAVIVDVLQSRGAQPGGVGVAVGAQSRQALEGGGGVGGSEVEEPLGVAQALAGRKVVDHREDQAADLAGQQVVEVFEGVGGELGLAARQAVVGARMSRGGWMRARRWKMLLR